MRIGADGAEMRWSRSGISRYLDGLLHAMERSLDGPEDLVVYYNSLDRRKLFGDKVTERGIRFPKATPWQQVRVPLALRTDRCDVYLGGSNVAPVLSPVPTVVIIHDCKAFRVPELVDRGSRWYFRTWQRRAAQRAAAVVTNSEWTAGECEHWFGVTPAKVVYPGLDPSFGPSSESLTEEADLRRDLGLGGGQFVLQVGAFEPHKGGETAVRAVELVRASGHDVTLVRCGRHGGVTNTDALVDVGHVDEATLRALYRAAAALCVPSTHEGFGLPVAEAMASGTPVVAVRACALPEVGGDVALYIAAGDSDAMAEHIRRLLGDPVEAERRGRAGIERARRFRWDDAAGAVLDVLRSVAR